MKCYHPDVSVAEGLGWHVLMCPVQVHRRVMWAGFWTVVLLYVVPVSALQALLQVSRPGTGREH